MNFAAVERIFKAPSKTTLDEFGNGGLFLRLGLLSTLIRHENGAFRKRSSNWRNLKTLACRFRVDRNHVIYLTEVFLKHGDCCVFKFLSHSRMNGKYLMRFQSENADF